MPAPADLLGPLYADLRSQLRDGSVGDGTPPRAVPEDDAFALLRAVPVPLYVTDSEGRILFYNKPAKELWGRDPDVEHDRWCGSWRLYTMEGDLLPHDEIAMAKAVLTGEPVADVEKLAARPDGSRVPFMSFPRLLRDHDGRISGAINMLVDLTQWKAADVEIRAAEHRYHLAAEAAGEVVWDHDLVRGVVTWSDAFQQRFGYAPAPQQGSSDWWRENIHPDDIDRVLKDRAEVLAGNAASFVSEYRLRRADGRYTAVLTRSSIIRDAEGRPVRAIGTMVDLSERKQAEEALRISEERLGLAARALGLGIADYDLVTGAIHWSDELRAMTGLSADGPVSWETISLLMDPDTAAGARADHARAVHGQAGSIFSATYPITRLSDQAKRWQTVDAAPIYDDEGTAVRLISVVRDVTDEKTAQDRVNWVATHDSVTGLPNRFAFQSALEAWVENAGRTGERLSVILIDLDDFKKINDSLGHQAGDTVLSSFAERLCGVIPGGATAARFGGDEFAVIVPPAAADASSDIAAQIQSAMHTPFAINGRKINVRLSIGVSVFPEHGGSASALVQNADLALYSAKAGGRSAVRLFDTSLRAAMQRQLSMLSEARNAISNGWIEPYYQPKLELATGKVVGFEGLLRWRHPTTGLQTPDSIASAFDDAELSGLIGDTMIEAVLVDLSRWRASGVPVNKVAINASAAEFRVRGYADRLQARLAAHGVDPGAIEVEITETALLTDRIDIVLDELTALRAAGITVALDDFGTGFSSLSHLRQFPVSAIKIDRSFVGGIGDSDGDRAIVTAVVGLGRALGMEIIAEGVETREQAEFLSRIGCHTAQGFLYSPALAASDIPSFIVNGSTSTNDRRRRAAS